jgi:hypothetical protein
MKKQQNEATAVISDRRLAANRANATLSTGPRTQAGKAASSRNAVSHGLSASQLTIFNWESPVEYAQLRSDYYTRFCPIDTSESDVVDRLVDSTWRRRRALVIETTLFDLEISATREATDDKYGETACGPLHLAIAFRNRHGEGVWDAIQRLLNAVDCSYSRALRDLEKLQDDRFNILPASYLQQEKCEPEPAASALDGDAEAQPDEAVVPALEPEPATAAAATRSTQNKIIEITKQTQQPKAPSATATFLPAQNENSKNEPTTAISELPSHNDDSGGSNRVGAQEEATAERGGLEEGESGVH